MEIIDEIKKILEFEMSLDVQDDCGSIDCWNKMLEILIAAGLNETINVLDNLEPKYFDSFRAIFDDLSLHFKSMKLIECMKRNAVRTNVNCDVDIEYAIQALKY